MTLNTTNLVSSIHQQMLTTGHKSYLSQKTPTRFGTAVPSSRRYKYKKSISTNKPNVPSWNDVLVLMPWRWHLGAEACRNFLRFMYDLYVIVCNCWWM